MKRLQINPKQGDFDVIASTSRSQVALMVLAPGESTGGPDNIHEDSDQWLYVIAGQGRAIVNGQKVDLQPATLLLIEAGEGHEITCTGEQALETINFYAPPEY